MELDRTSEARRKAQRNGEEDPVVVAQRFLNIYRQLHIFNAERKASFNKMLLELPPQIRGMFGQLPGGALLQDYVDELAEKEGVAKSVQSQPQDIADDEVKQAKILATALAEAQIQTTAKMQEMGAIPPMAAAAVSAGAAAPAATTAKLAMDKTFAQEFASVLAAAMQKNAANQESEIKNIINTLGQTQLEIIKVLQTENTEHREEMKKISQMMLESKEQINSAQPQKTSEISDETKQLIKILVTGQRQMIERVAKVEALANQFAAAEKGAGKEEKKPETDIHALSLILEQNEQNFSKMVTALNERQKNDTLEIARLINESQQNLVQMLVQHNTLNQNSGNAAASNNNANNIQINTTDYSAVLDKIATQLSHLQPAAPVQSDTPASAANIQINFPEQAISEIVKAQSELYRTIAAEQTKELSAIISLALKEIPKISVPTVVAMPTAAQPQTFAPSYVPENVDNSSQPTSSYPDENKDEAIDFFNDENAEDIFIPEPEIEDTAPIRLNEYSAPEEEAPVPEEPEIIEEEPVKKKKRKRKKKKKNIDAGESAGIVETATAEAETIAAETETDAFSEDVVAEAADLPLMEESPLPQLDEITETPAEVIAEPEETEEALIPDPPEEAQSTNIWLDTPADDVEDIAEEVFETETLQPEDNADDWGFTPAADEPSTTDEQNWEWAYEEVPADDTATGEGEEWVWEYVPENETSDEIIFHNDNSEKISQQSPIVSDNLFFQEQVYNAQPLVRSTFSLPLQPGLNIFDSALPDENDDPYQNSARKD